MKHRHLADAYRLDCADSRGFGWPPTDVNNVGATADMVAVSDVREVPRADWEKTTVADVMAPDVVTVTPRTLLRECVRVMTDKNIDRVPVVDPKEPERMVGIISSTDALSVVKTPVDSR